MTRIVTEVNILEPDIKKQKTVRVFTASEEAQADKDQAEDIIENDARVLAEFRIERNARLVKSDASVLPDIWEDLSDEAKASWKTYRQQLRDLPANTADPANPTWPTAPA